MALENGILSTNFRIKRWLTKRVFAGKLSEGEKHIAFFLQGCQQVLQQRNHTKDKGMAVCFCGPSSLSTVIKQSVEMCGDKNEIEFSSDHL